MAWVLALVCLGACAHAPAQQAPPYFHHQAWSTEDGLPQASVHALLQSRDGYLWVGTEDGLARFDGQSFRVLNHETTPAMTSTDVSCLAEDTAGALWIGTSDGVVRKRGEDFRRFSKRNGLPSDEVLALNAEGSDLLVLTSSGLAVWRADRFETVAPEGNIVALSETPTGPIAIDGQGRWYRWDHGRLVPTGQARQEASPVLGAVVSDARAVWSFGADFVRLTAASRTKTWRTGVELPGNRVQALVPDADGKVWVGTNRGLVSIDDAPDFRVEEAKLFRGESVLSLRRDREGDLWIGTEGSGLHTLQPRKFATVPGSESEAVTTIARDSEGRMYFGTRDDGIFRSDHTVTPIVPEKLTSPVVLALTAGPHGDLWAGTPDGLNHITGTAVQRWTIADGLPDNFVRSVLVDTDGTAWAGTRFGLVHIDGSGVHSFTSANGLRSSSIGPLLEVHATARPAANAEGVLWVGTSAGLCRRTAQQFQCVAAQSGPKDSIITALGADGHGAIWAGIHGRGLALATADTLAPVRSSALPKEILGILADGTGHLWLRATRGLYRVRTSDLQACLSGRLQLDRLRVDDYGRSDGMESDEATAPGSYPAADGPDAELWFATRRGVAVTDPRHMLANRVAPGVAVTQAVVDNMIFPRGSPVRIGPSHQRYSFEYIGLSLNNPARVRYQYRLDGFDHAWVNAGTRRIAYYTNLPPGRYTFRVMAANGDGVWSRTEATIAFRVMAPWYRSARVYLLAGCLVILALVGLVRLRLRREARRFELVLQERSRVAREVHDTLAQDLVSVSLQVEIAAQHARSGRTEELIEQLAQARGTVRQAIESARQSIWNLRANLSEDSLPVRLTARLEDSRSRGLAARLHIGGEYRSAAAELENEVMRVAGEAIANVEKHAKATELQVRLDYGADSLRLEVRDDGRGFDYASSHSLDGHYGLKGLKERAAVLQGELHVHSAPGQGTTVTLTLSLPGEK